MSSDSGDMDNTPTPQVAALATHNQGKAIDISGFSVFAYGEIGVAHAQAHQLLDQGRNDLGYQLLSAWLKTHDGEGSDWVHVQWHMAVFEIALGLHADAAARFETHILPAVSGLKALTDAPQLAWRLSMADPSRRSLPWGPLRDAAIARMRRPSTLMSSCTTCSPSLVPGTCRAWMRGFGRAPTSRSVVESSTESAVDCARSLLAITPMQQPSSSRMYQVWRCSEAAADRTRCSSKSSAKP